MLPPCWSLVQIALFTLKMEAVHSSEMSGDCKPQRYIPEGSAVCGSVSVLRWNYGEAPAEAGSLDTVNLSHGTWKLTGPS